MIKQAICAKGLDIVKVSERVKLKRPAFKKIIIDPFQFIAMKKKSIKEDYELIKVIGQGAFGKVYHSFSKKAA